MDNPRGKEVSREMSQVLSRLSGDIPPGRVKEVQELLRHREIPGDGTYIRCTWFGGCHYCEDHAHTWHLIECYA
jgi:hypothetical protein